jgi:hypothetical protein
MGGILVLAWSGAALGGDRAHDGGFFLRLSAGAGSASSELSLSGASAEMSGTSGDVNIAIGGIVSPNLAIHGTLFGWTIQDPDVTASGGGMYGEGTLDGTLTLGAFGGGITYYVMPANVYFSASVGVGRLRIESEGQDANTDLGPVADLTIGKEWWVGSSWGLGVAGSVGYHSVPEKNISENWSGPSFAIRFTATMN